jgi:hypothetical protein
MSALTVTLGADITALKRAMAGATELVSASAVRMGRITGAGLAGIGRGGVAVLGKGLDLAGVAFKASIGAAMAGGAAAVGVGVKAVTAAAKSVSQQMPLSPGTRSDRQAGRETPAHVVPDPSRASRRIAG